MTKAELNVLEKAFMAEVEDRLPFQPRQSKAVIQCVNDGLLQPMTVRSGMVTMSGYQLTHAGRYLYCSSCDSPSGDSHEV